jgi:hypothetical protein
LGFYISAGRKSGVKRAVFSGEIMRVLALAFCCAGGVGCAAPQLADIRPEASFMDVEPEPYLASMQHWQLVARNVAQDL